MHAWEWLRSWRFLASRRWILFAVAVAVVGYGTWWLGEWQFGRLDDRQQRNAVIRANEERPPVPVEEVLEVGGEVAGGEEWRLVRATGEYAPEDTVVVRYRTRDGLPGVNAVVPLVTEAGTALLVDRGWLQTDNRGATAAELPSPPDGEVTITGWVRADGTGRSTEVADQATRAISSEQIGPALDREVYGGFVELRSEDPEPAEALAPAELPDLDDGPHFFYGLQWWFFGVLALGGFLYLAWDERRHGRRGSRGRSHRVTTATAPDTDQRARESPPSTGTMTPVMNEAAGESRNAAARPNSSGSP